MRLGGPVFGDCSTPELWVSAVRKHGYRAVYCPVGDKADAETIRAYEAAARKADIIISEVGAWSNPLSPNDEVRIPALELCKKRLALADEIGAMVCVNIVGSRGEQWDGPHEDNFTPETFDMIVEMVRDIIDSVQPKRAFYALETMPWMMPDSPDCYLEILKAIDRKQCGVHFDPVNMICSPRRYFANADFLRECFAKLGPYIKTCHAKDITLSGKLTTHLDETRPGLGRLDYGVFLRELDKLHPDTPIMVEHLPNEEEYALAIEHIRSVAQREGLSC